jgi:hypothetical protein
MSAVLFSTMHVTCPSQIKFLDSVIWIIKTSVRHWNYKVSKRICSNPLLLPSLRSKYSPQLLALSVCYQLPCYAALLKKYCMLRKPQYNTVSCYNKCFQQRPETCRVREDIWNKDIKQVTSVGNTYCNL